MKFRLSDTSHIFSRYIYQINWSRNICCNLKLKFILHDSPLSQKTKFGDGLLRQKFLSQRQMDALTS